MVAITFQPREWKWRAVSRPYPEEQPVMSTVFMSRSPVSGRCGHDIGAGPDALQCGVHISFVSVQTCTTPIRSRR